MSDNSDLLVLKHSELLKKYDPDGKLTAYFKVLKEENQKINLVSRETISTTDGLNLLTAESLIPFEIISRTEFKDYLDIGSGGGLPSIPILLTRKIYHTALVERTKKKASALCRIIKQIQISNTSINIVEKTFEECHFDNQFDLITLRQVKLTEKIFEKIVKLIKNNGCFIYYSKLSFCIKSDRITSKTYYYHNHKDKLEKAFTIIRK